MVWGQSAWAKVRREEERLDRQTVANRAREHAKTRELTKSGAICVQKGCEISGGTMNDGVVDGGEELSSFCLLSRRSDRRESRRNEESLDTCHQ